ncbi:MAG: hypothetical protein ACI9OJ_003369 [Myxococcota bacterium]|jgi:hypothetical protein
MRSSRHESHRRRKKPWTKSPATDYPALWQLVGAVTEAIGEDQPGAVAALREKTQAALLGLLGLPPAALRWDRPLRAVFMTTDLVMVAEATPGAAPGPDWTRSADTWHRGEGGGQSWMRRHNDRFIVSQGKSDPWPAVAEVLEAALRRAPRPGMRMALQIQLLVGLVKGKLPADGPPIVGRWVDWLADMLTMVTLTVSMDDKALTVHGRMEMSTTSPLRGVTYGKRPTALLKELPAGATAGMVMASASNLPSMPALAGTEAESLAALAQLRSTALAVVDGETLSLGVVADRDAGRRLWPT